MLAALPPEPPVVASYYETQYRKKDAIHIQEASDGVKKTIKYSEDFTNLLNDAGINTIQNQKIVGHLASFLVLTQPYKISFERTPEDSYLVKANFDDKNYFLAIYFDADEKAGYDCFLNVYQNKKHVFSYHGELENAFLKLINS
jgi:hypothetical protein